MSHLHKPLRVLLVTYTGGTGGVAVLLRTLVERFRENKEFYFEMCITQELGPVSDEIAALGIPIHFLGMHGGLDLIRGIKLIQIIRQGEFDVVDFHGIIPLVRLLIAVAHPRVQVINEHGAIQGDRARGRGYFKHFHRILDRWTDMYVAVCNPCRIDLETDHHVSREKITVIHNGVDLARFTGIARKRKIAGTSIVLEPSTIVVGTVRGLIEKMGIDHLVDAAFVVITKNPDVLFVVVGDGPLRMSLEAKVHSYGLDERVLFLGTRRDVPELLASFDMFALPSVWEGLPISAIESLAMGVPVVGYDVGGNNEVVIDGVTGILIRQRDPALLAEGILSLSADENLRHRMSLSSRQYAENHFDINETAQQFLELYKSLCNRKMEASL